MCVCKSSIAVLGGKLRFLSGRPRNIWHCIFHHSFYFLGAKYCNPFYDCHSFGSLGEVFAHGGEFQLSFLIVVGLSHGVKKGGCSLGLFKYDSYVPVRAIGLTWVFES